MSGTNPSQEQVQADIAATSSSKLFEQLSSSEKGLSSEEAKARQQKYGMNDISEKKVNPLDRDDGGPGRIRTDDHRVS